MGLTEIQKEMIRGIATNNMLKARQGALGALNERHHAEKQKLCSPL